MIFSLILSLVTFTNLTTTIIDNRSKDIAVLKASGGSIHKIYSHFMTQVIQLSFLVGGLSIVVGIGFYLLSIFVLASLLGFVLQSSIPLVQLLVALFGVVALCSVLGHRYVARAARSRVAQVFSAEIRDVELLRSETWFEKRISKPGSPLRVALRNVRRTRPLAMRLATCVFISVVLTSSVLIGGVVGDQTTVNYVNHAINQEFIFVGNHEMWTQYSSLIGFQESPSYNASFNYLKPEYEINASVISQIGSLSGVTGIDPRLIYETELLEVKVTLLPSGDQTEYQIIGDDRSASVLVTGVEPEKVISDWLISGRFINASDHPYVPGAYSSIVIGDSLESIFQDSTVEKAEIIGKNFRIVGTALDPVNSGKTAYMLHDVLGSLLGFNGYNMVLVECNPAEYATTLSLIQQVASANGLSAIPMKTTVLNTMNSIHSTWLAALLPVLLLLLTLVLSIVSYMSISFETNKQDFGVMRGIGASPRHIRKTLVMQSIIVSLWPSIAGIIFGLIISVWFFIPSAVAVPSSIAISIIVLLAVLFSAFAIASIASSRVCEKRVMNIIR
jgi:ABC-type antimicrobial peptide transport system permease subunit